MERSSQFTLTKDAGILAASLAKTGNSILAIIAIHQLNFPSIKCLVADTEETMYQCSSDFLKDVPGHHQIGNSSDYPIEGQLLQRSYNGKVDIIYVLEKPADKKVAKALSLTFVRKMKKKVPAATIKEKELETA